MCKKMVQIFLKAPNPFREETYLKYKYTSIIYIYMCVLITV
jgi:hypothetical protein